MAFYRSILSVLFLNTLFGIMMCLKIYQSWTLENLNQEWLKVSKVSKARYNNDKRKNWNCLVSCFEILVDSYFVLHSIPQIVSNLITTVLPSVNDINSQKLMDKFNQGVDSFRQLMCHTHRGHAALELIKNVCGVLAFDESVKEEVEVIIVWAMVATLFFNTLLLSVWYLLIVSFTCSCWERIYSSMFMSWRGIHIVGFTMTLVIHSSCPMSSAGK